MRSVTSRYPRLRRCLWALTAIVLLASPIAWANYEGPFSLTLSGDCTNVVSAITCTKTNGVSLTTNATAAVGQLPGTATNDNAAAGKVGEFVSSTVTSGSAVPLTTSTGADITTISLTAGDWDIRVFCRIIGGTNTTVTASQCGWSQSAATIDFTNDRYAQFTGTTLTLNGSDFTQGVPPGRIQLTGTTTIHMVMIASFGVSTLSAYGIIEARRVR